MKTYIIPEKEVENYRNTILNSQLSCVEETTIRIDMLGYEEMEIEEAKEKANIGDCLLVEYCGNMLPFQVVHKMEVNGKLRCVLQSYYLLEKRAFDENTNVWKDCELRRYLNGNFLNKFNPEFVKLLQTTEVHTDNYVTHDLVWIPSHEEIGYEDDSNMFKKNKGTFTYDYYKKSGGKK